MSRGQIRCELAPESLGFSALGDLMKRRIASLLRHAICDYTVRWYYESAFRMTAPKREH